MFSFNRDEIASFAFGLLPVFIVAFAALKIILN